MITIPWPSLGFRWPGCTQWFGGACSGYYGDRDERWAEILFGQISV
jgi:hypothetical protein